MTAAQTHAIDAAMKTARNLVHILRTDGGMSFSQMQEMAVVCAVATAQIGMARQVAQYPANERAEIAMLDEATIAQLITNLTLHGKS